MIRALAALALLLAVPASAQVINPWPAKTVDGFDSVMSYSLYDDMTGKGAGSVFRNVKATVQRRGFRFGAGGPYTVQDSEIRLKAPTTGSNLPVGGEAVGTAHDILYADTVMRGFTMVPVEGKYTNGGGFSSEPDNSNITYRRTAVHDSSEGYDDKGRNVFYDHAMAYGVGRGFRCWQDCRASTITVDGWTNGAVTLHDIGWIKDALGQPIAATFVIDTLVARNKIKAPVVRIMNTRGVARLTIKRCYLIVPKGTPVVVTEPGSKAVVKLGAGCKA